MSDFVQWIDKRVNDYGLCIEENASSANDIIDTSELPHPKEEILDALIVSMIFSSISGITLTSKTLTPKVLSHFEIIEIL